VILAQLSDFHLSSTNPERLERLARAIDQLLKLDPCPDAVIVTGDVADKGEPAMYELAAEQLKRLPMPVFAVPGNRDWTEPFRLSLAPWCGMDETGFLNIAGEMGDLRLLGLDSRRPGTQQGQFTQQSKAWLEARLNEQSDRPTAIFLHHPPFRTKLRNGTIGHQIQGIETLEEVVRKHPNVVQLLCGHLHRIYAVPVAGIIATSAPSVAYQGIVEHWHDAPDADIRPVSTLHYWHDGRLISRLAW
jgi:3',5'-cyclic AMP phosphodiesterase CpdA